MTDDNPESLRERTRRAVRQQLADSAMRLFVEQGFEATTIDQIAADTGISRRSFFRYFASKEDVVLGELFDRGGIVATALAGRPPGESPWDAVKAALLELQRVTRASDESELQLGRMLYDTPTLRARHLEKQLAWQDLLVPILSERIRSTGRATGIDPHSRPLPSWQVPSHVSTWRRRAGSVRTARSHSSGCTTTPLPPSEAEDRAGPVDRGSSSARARTPPQRWLSTIVLDRI